MLGEQFEVDAAQAVTDKHVLAAVAELSVVSRVCPPNRSCDQRGGAAFCSGCNSPLPTTVISILFEVTTTLLFQSHCCPRQDRPVAWLAENRSLGGAPVDFLGGGLRFEVSRPVQVIPEPG